MTQHTIPDEGLARLWQIVGSKKHGIQPVIPVSKSAWWDGVKAGRFPKPLKLSPRVTVWRWADIRKLLDQHEAGGSR